MNASCIICSDIFTPRSDIFTTACGHLFHQDCLKQWIERSKTCPQCRHKETFSTIHRVYLNLASAEGIAEDVITLQAKLDTVKFEVSVKEKDVTKYSEKYKACKAKCTRMREAIVEMEQEQRTHESSMLALQYQLTSYRDKVKDKEKLLSEIEQLKKQIDNMDHVKSAVSNCDQQVSQMLNLNNDPDSLGILSVTLKRQLEDTKQKKQDMSTQLFRIGKEMLNTNNTIEKLKTRNEHIKKSLVIHQNCNSEISYLTQRIRETKMKLPGSAGNCTITSRSMCNDSIIVLDTPPPLVPISRRTSHDFSSPPELLSTPNTSQSQREPVIIKIPITETSSEQTSSASTFYSQAKPLSVSNISQRSGLKRVKSVNSFTSTTKFRKLAPGNTRKPM